MTILTQADSLSQACDRADRRCEVKPQRIQLRRTKGWRMPADTVSVARPGPFGNPFTVAGAIEAGYGTHNSDGTRATDQERRQRLAEWCVSLFRRWLAGTEEHDSARREKLLARLPELRGKNLACWCKPGTPCHADVLIEMANKDAANET